MAVTHSTSPHQAEAPAKATERRIAKEEFAAQLRSLFIIHPTPDTTTSAELVEVADRAPAPGYEQFSLVFRAPVGTAPVQRIYELEHPVLGALRLFLAPIGQDAGGICFEAAFNRPLARASAEG